MAQATKLKYWFLCGVPLILNIYPYWAAYFIIAYIFCWLIEGRLKEKAGLFLQNKYAWLFAGFYLIHVIGMLYTSNDNIDFNRGLFSLQVKLSLLVFPIVLSTEGIMNIDKQKPIIYSLITGCVVNGLFCIGYAIWKFYTQNLFQFQYMQFSAILHPSYFSMYINICFLFTFYLFTGKDVALSKIEKRLLIISVFFLEVILVMLQSKMGLIISSALIILLLARYAISFNYKRPAMLILVGAAIYFLTSHFIIGQHSRVVSSTQILINDTVKNTAVESSQARKLVWTAALQVIKRSPVIGVGTGDADTCLVKQYLIDGYTGVAREHLNAHNEYLQAAVMLGAIGLLYMLTCFIFPFIKCIKEKRFVYGTFITIIAINLLVESMFGQQSGTIFYGMFNSLLMFNFVI